MYKIWFYFRVSLLRINDIVLLLDAKSSVINTFVTKKYPYRKLIWALLAEYLFRQAEVIFIVKRIPVS